MELPTGTVRFLFTDLEGSTRLPRELGDAYAPVQDDHMRLMREAIAEGGSTVIRTKGDAFFAVFPSATGAVQAAVTAQRAFASYPWAHAGRGPRVPSPRSRDGRELRRPHRNGLSLDNLADQEIGRGHVARAMRLAGASEAIKEVVGGQAPPKLTGLAHPRARAREVLSDEQIEEAWREGREMTLEEALAFAREEEEE